MVTGECGSGKSIVAVAIVRALADLGCKNVTLQDKTSGYDETYSTIYRNLYRDPGRIELVLPVISVVIETKNVRRGPDEVMLSHHGIII